MIQHVIFYVVLHRRAQLEENGKGSKKNSDLLSKREKRDLIYISLIGAGAMLFAVFGIALVSSSSDNHRFLFMRSMIVTALWMAQICVLLLRFILVFIKDLGFVETDGYKSKTRRYEVILTSITGVVSVSILASHFIDPESILLFQVNAFVSIAFMVVFSLIELREFLQIMKNEHGKLNDLNRLRFRRILVAYLIMVAGGIAQLLIRLIFDVAVTRNLGSLFMYSVVAASVLLSLNLLVEYIEIFERMKKNNRKMADLNKSMMDDVRLAQSLQISLLPIDKQREIQKRVDMEISYMPMQSVGGDYYDFYLLDENKILFLLGDASGHGIYAAMIWAMLKVEVEEIIEERGFDDLAESFTLLNRRITRILENTYSYATLFSFLIDMKEMTVTYISAGHSDQIYYSGRNEGTAKIKNKNPIIGTFKNAKYYCESISIQQGDAFLMFTDGINEEVNNENEQLGTDRVEMMFGEACRKNDGASQILNEMLMKIEEFSEGSMQHDDRTMLVIRV